jgi:protein TonB
MYALLPLALSAATLLATADPQTSARGASCAIESRPAAIVQPIIPDYPEIARREQISGKTTVRVDLSETGLLAHVFVQTSSGSTQLDQAALRAAKSMTYAPEIQGCNPVAGSYAIEVNFVE